MRWPFDQGQIVVCINAKGLNAKLQFSAILVEGKKYIIRSCFEPIGKEPDWGVHLEEIQGIFIPEFNIEAGFKSLRFRPLDSMDEQISIILKNAISGNYDKSLDKEENPYKRVKELI